MHFHCLILLSESKNNGSSKRYSRKREPSFPKSDTFPGPRRTNSQKGKNFDKRPPQRGGRQYGAAGGGRREEVIWDFKTFQVQHPFCDVKKKNVRACFCR